MQTGADNQLPLMLSNISNIGRRDFNGISLAAPITSKNCSNKMLRVNEQATKHGQRLTTTKARRNKM